MRKGWTRIENNLSEHGLSLEEYGLIVYLQTNFEYFKVSPTHIAKKFKKDIRSVNKILEKLSEMGYIKLVLNNTCKSTLVEINTGVNQHSEEVEINTGDSVNQHLKLVEINTTRRKKTIEKNKKKEKSIKKENTALSVQKIKNENHKSVNSKMNALEIFKVEAIANKENLLAMPEIEGNEELLRRYYGYFTDYLKNRKKPYKDYVAAFRISIRADWANLKRYKSEKIPPKTFKELESERIKKNLEKFEKGGKVEDQNWESLIYSFLELHEVNGAELKVSAWCDSLKKFTYKQVQDAMKNFNETRESWEICGISRVIFRIQKEQKIDYVDLEEKKRLLKSGEIFTKMMALHLKARDLDIMGFFTTNRYSGASFNQDGKVISYGEKGAIIDHIANEFKNIYGHSADKPWQLSLQYNYKANQEEILLQET